MHNSLLQPDAQSVIHLPADTTPRLMVVVDTEEQFNWALPHSRKSTAVDAILGSQKAQEIFARYGITPVYLVDYPVACQEPARSFLRDLLAGGQAIVGAHLHPWVNPPYEEEVTPRNSFPGNLPAALEREKLKRLTDAIATNLGITPTLYRAGRYGVGPATAEILHECGYEIDLSVVPESDFRDSFGPDFRACPAEPYWFGPGGKLLEIPLSVGFTGMAARLGKVLYSHIAHPLGRKLHLPGLFARAGIMERIRLSPEGITFEEQKRLMTAMIGQGKRVFGFTYHSPSLVPGHTPYVRNADDLNLFLENFDRFFAYFFGEIGGVATTPATVNALAIQAASDCSPMVQTRRP